MRIVEKIKLTVDEKRMLAESLRHRKGEHSYIIAEDLGIPEQQLVNKLNFKNDALNHEQLINYLRHPAVNPLPYLTQLCGMFNCAVDEGKEDKKNSLSDIFWLLGKATVEFNDLAEEINKSTINGYITSDEFIRLVKEADEAQTAITNVKKAAAFLRTSFKQGTVTQEKEKQQIL